MLKKETELEKALNYINDQSAPKMDIQNDIGLNDFIINTIKANLCATIGIKFDLNNVYVTVIYPSETKLIKFNDYSHEAYLDFCKTVLNIDMNEQYNCSRTSIINGVRTRIYAVMPPFSENPNITISTTKIPPQTLNKQTIPDEIWDKIVHSNFIVVGKSGSGKTYLTNYLLSRYIRKNERIALIEEFGELIPPNELTNSIIVPPPKPGNPSLLKFVTEQSNLMRLDAFYVGEIKGAEAWPFVVNLASGTRGGATLHGETAVQGLSRLRALCQLSCNNDNAIDEFISKSVKYVIVMRNKNIESINRLTGVHNKGSFTMEEIYS